MLTIVKGETEITFGRKENKISYKREYRLHETNVSTINICIRWFLSFQSPFLPWVENRSARRNEDRNNPPSTKSTTHEMRVRIKPGRVKKPRSYFFLSLFMLSGIRRIRKQQDGEKGREKK